MGPEWHDIFMLSADCKIGEMVLSEVDVDGDWDFSYTVSYTTMLLKEISSKLPDWKMPQLQNVIIIADETLTYRRLLASVEPNTRDY